MTLTDFSTIASILSSFAVVASLVYLGLQTRQNVKHTRAEIQLGRAARIIAINMAMADADLVAALILSDGGTPTPEEIKRRQARIIYATVFAGYMDTFDQYSAGLLSAEQFAIFRAATTVTMRRRGYREFWNHWKETRTDAHPKFRTFVDEAVSRGGAAC